MPDLSKQENEDILTVHDDDQAIEAEESAQYDPLDTESSVVVIEPPIIAIGRSKRAKALRDLQDQPGDH